MSNTQDQEKHYNQLTKFQKEVVDALSNLGFTHKYFNIYELIGWGDIDVARYNNWGSILRVVHEQGKDQKRFEIQRALGL